VAKTKVSYYTTVMTWDYDKKEYNKQARNDPAWHYERLINYGLGGQKLNKAELTKVLPKLKIPPQRRLFLELLLWNKPF